MTTELCIHGGLRRQCETCDLADRLTAAEAALAAATQEIERLKAERDKLQAAFDAEFTKSLPPTMAASLCVAMKDAAEREHARAEAAERQRDALREALKSLLDSHNMNAQCSHDEEPDYCVQCEFEQQIRVASAADAARAALAATEGQ